MENIVVTIEFTRYAELLMFLIEQLPTGLGIHNWFLNGIEKNPRRYLKTTYDQPPDKVFHNYSKDRTEAQKGQ